MSHPSGLVQAYRADLGAPFEQWVPLTAPRANTRLNESVTILLNLLTKGDIRYRLSGMYLEYSNAAGPIAVPSYGAGPGNGRAYYDSLSSSPTFDYLRVPLVQASILAATDSNYPDGNQMRFLAQSSGYIGVHGKTFSHGASSTVIGGAIVAMVDENDPSQDLVFSRFYFAPADQQLKPVSQQISVGWTIPLP